MKHVLLVTASLCMLISCSDDPPPEPMVSVVCTDHPEPDGLEPQDVTIYCDNGDDGSDNDDVIVSGNYQNGGVGGAGGSGQGGAGGGTSEKVCSFAETKCTTADGAPGWCLSKYWKPNDPMPNTNLVCVACDDTINAPGDPQACPPGCSAPGDVCQGQPGEGGCPPECCPICY